MGTWGSPSPKPSRCWGTALGAKRLIYRCFAWSFSTCNTSYVSSAFQGHGCLPCIGPLLRSKENNWQNEQRSWRLPSSVVSMMGPFLCPHLSLVGIWLKNHRLFNIDIGQKSSFFCLRSGGPDLRATQVYPIGYGKRVCTLHNLLMDLWDYQSWVCYQQKSINFYTNYYNESLLSHLLSPKHCTSKTSRIHTTNHTNLNE